MTARATAYFALLIAAAATPLLGQAKVSGKVTINGKTYELRHAIAFQQSTEPGSEVTLVISDEPIPATTAKDTFGLIHFVEDGKAHGLKFLISGNQAISGTVLDKATISTSGSWTGMFLVDLNKDGVVQGHAALTEPKTTFGNTYQYTVTVTAPVELPKPETPATPEEMKAAEASPQAAVYRAFEKAVQAKDIAALKGMASAELRKQMDDPEFPKMLDFIREIAPVEVRLQKLTVDGSAAVLTAKGKDSDGKPSTGVINLVKEGAAWKMSKQSWNTKAN